jgi:DnaK suppressor protein
MSEGAKKNGNARQTGTLVSLVKREMSFQVLEASRPDALLPVQETGDVLDLVSNERSRELTLLLTARKRERRMAIEQALEKAENGSYGVCEECGSKIEAARLKAVPLAKLCISCQELLEKGSRFQMDEGEEFPFDTGADREGEDLDEI